MCVEKRRRPGWKKKTKEEKAKAAIKGVCKGNAPPMSDDDNDDCDELGLGDDFFDTSD